MAGELAHFQPVVLKAFSSTRVSERVRNYLDIQSDARTNSATTPFRPLDDDPSNLKTMADLYGSSSTLKWAKLDEDELEEYKELLDLAKETGRYPAYQELDNPFYTEEEEGYSGALVILKRFGYTSTTSGFLGVIHRFKAPGWPTPQSGYDPQQRVWRE